LPSVRVWFRSGDVKEGEGNQLRDEVLVRSMGRMRPVLQKVCKKKRGDLERKHSPILRARKQARKFFGHSLYVLRIGEHGNIETRSGGGRRHRPRVGKGTLRVRENVVALKGERKNND